MAGVLQLVDEKVEVHNKKASKHCLGNVGLVSGVNSTGGLEFPEDKVNEEELEIEIKRRSSNKLYDIFLKPGLTRHQNYATPSGQPSTPKRKRSPTDPMICGTPTKRATLTDTSPSLRPRVLSCSGVGRKISKGSRIGTRGRPRTQSVGQKLIADMFPKKCDKSESLN